MKLKTTTKRQGGYIDLKTDTVCMAVWIFWSLWSGGAAQQAI